MKTDFKKAFFSELRPLLENHREAERFR